MTTAPVRGDFREDLHPRIPGGHGGGEFTHSPGSGSHLGDAITDPPASAALKMKGRYTFAGAEPGDPALTKLDAKLTRPLMGAGPNKGKVRRPAVPPYHESVARTSAEMVALIGQEGTLEEGRKWYPDEHAMNHRRALAYHVPIETAIGVEAATCPRVQWIINQRVTNELLDEVPKAGRTVERIKIAHHLGGGVMASFRDEGVNIILGANVDKELGGTKRRNFYNNIMWPGQTDSVTVDTWMLQALKPLGLDDDQVMALGSQAQAGLADGIGKVIVADAARDAAARLTAQGTPTTPDGVQAAYWIAVQQARGLSDPTAHANPRDISYMHAAAPGPAGYGEGLTDDQWDAELLLQYLTWLAADIPAPRIDLGSPGSARLAGGLAADNPAAWKLALADPRFGRLGMTTAQARQAVRGPATTASAPPRGPFTVRENHPACPTGTPHATVHHGTGTVAMCHRTKAGAQDLALTLNFPDATPVTPGATIEIGAAGAGKFREDLHPRRGKGHGGGEFAPGGGGGGSGHRPSQRTSQRRRQAEVRRPARTPAGPAQHAPAGEGITAPQAQLAAADLSRLISDQVAVATSRLSREQHEAMREVKAELERSQAQLAALHMAEIHTEEQAHERHKSLRKLIHHIIALAAVAVLTFIGVRTGLVDNPMVAGLAATGPLFLQEALDAIKKV